MSLRLQINLIITLLLGLVASLLIGLQVENTRRSVREEMVGAHVVATQLLSRMQGDDGRGRLTEMAEFLGRVGRIRAHEVELYDAQGRLVYSSPPTLYKAGREAPQWYARIVSPTLMPREIVLPQGRLLLRTDPSRAALDGWDDLQPTLWAVLAGFVLLNVLVYALVGRALKPLQQVVQGLRQVAQGDYAARLPVLTGREGRLIGQAFNHMAASVQDSLAAREQARQATQALAENRELTQLIQSRIEQERGAIARELHDELGQQVTAIKSVGLAIARRAQGQDAMVEQSARLVMDCADQIYDGMHRLIGRLRPLALDRFGLRDALQDLLADWRAQQSGVDWQLTLDGSLDALDEARATAVYRIVQEAVNNALRHAQAGRIAVCVQAAADEVRLTVTDNGSGRIEALEAAGHYGVAGMRERAQALGGSFALEAVASGGVRVQARLPTKDQAHE